MTVDSQMLTVKERPDVDGGRLLLRLEKTSLREQALTALRRAITTGQLPPGTHLVETELSDALQISRGTLREAMRQLQQEGLISARCARPALGPSPRRQGDQGHLRRPRRAGIAGRKRIGCAPTTEREAVAVLRDGGGRIWSGGRRPTSRTASRQT